jgi:hypothetical protein
VKEPGGHDLESLTWSDRRPVGCAQQPGGSLAILIFVPSVQRLRKRMPLVVFILLLVMLLMVVGIACACATQHPMKAVDRAISAPAALPALIEIWTYTFAAILLVVFFVPQRRRALGRASPQELQRFLF